MSERGATLLALARRAIASELGLEPPPAPPIGGWLEAFGASFVTLKLDRRLRGCVGTLEAWRRLCDDVQANARAAAFRDRRFEPLSREEFSLSRLEVSLLSPLQPIPCRSERELIERLRPGIDGIAIRYGEQRATFLPQVWCELPEPATFWSRLKKKAGLEPEFWSPEILVERYSVSRYSD